MKNALILAALAAALASCGRRQPEAHAEPEPKAGSGLITMERTAQTRIGLEVAPARTTQLNEYLQVTGTVQPVDSRVAQVRPPARGRLLEVRAKVGDRVRAGQELARLDNLEAVELAAQLAAARAELDRARVLLASQARQAERDRKLSAIGAAPRKDYEQSDAGRQAMEAGVRSQEAAVAGLVARLRRFGGGPDPAAAVVTAIAAPFGGIVTKAAATPGALVDSAVELFTIADIAEVWVQAEVYEKDLGRLQVGQAARVRVDTYPNEPFTGRVAYIADALDPQTRTAKVRCVVGNAGARLKLDMFATVELPTTFRRRAVAVPVGAIQQLESKTVVFVQRGPTQFEAREITAGGSVDGVVEVLAGLKDGEPIVTVGSFHLKSIVAGKDLGEE